jgi:hypothetical protein
LFLHVSTILPALPTPGVYNPPYSDLLPRAFEKPIEEHLRDACLATGLKWVRKVDLKLGWSQNLEHKSQSHQTCRMISSLSMSIITVLENIENIAMYMMGVDPIS